MQNRPRRTVAGDFCLTSTRSGGYYRSMELQPTIDRAVLTDRDQTGRAMQWIVEEFYTDLDDLIFSGVRLSDLTLPDYYHVIRSVPYEMDPQGAEIITRPAFLVRGRWSGWDCKKKSVMIGAWLRRHGIPYRFVAVSSRPSGEIHHVITEAWIDDEWVEIDATYPHNTLFGRQQWTETQVLGGDTPDPTDTDLVVMYGAADRAAVNAWSRYMQEHHPAAMGDAGTVVGIVAAIVSALASITGTIVGAVMQAREQDVQEGIQQQQIRTWQETQTALAEQAAAEAEAEREAEEKRQEEQRKLLTNVILPGAAIVGALLFFR